MNLPRKLLERSAVLSLIVLTLVSGCATKRIVSQWSNPEYANAARPFHRVLVVGTTDQDSIRRNFEDRMVSVLQSNGVEASPSYRMVTEPGANLKESDERLQAAIKKTNADAVLVTRLLRTEQRADVSPGYYQPYMGFGYNQWWGPGWYGGFYSPPMVSYYPIYYSETTLYDAAKNDVVWTGTIRTIDPENADEAITDYVNTVVTALKDKHLITGLT